MNPLWEEAEALSRAWERDARRYPHPPYEEEEEPV